MCKDEYRVRVAKAQGKATRSFMRDRFDGHLDGKLPERITKKHVVTWRN